MTNWKEILELNENSNFKYKIGEKNSNILEDNNETFQKVRNFTSLDFYLPSVKENKLIIKYYGFPTDESPSCLASYHTKQPEDVVFGISVNSDIDISAQTLLSHGYQQGDNDNCFVKGVVKITLNNKSYKIKDYHIKKKDNLFSEEEKLLTKITSIEISLQTKYLGNRIY